MQNAMKIRFIILMLAIVGCFTSCYDDKSNNSVKTINPLVIDMGGVPTSMSAFLLDTLEIKPVVYKIGSDDADLSYKWEISGNDIMPFVLDSTMTLKAVVSVAPNSNPYTIILTVTDNRTNLQNYEQFSLSVYSNLGKGLVVADTRDGINTDLNLIMSQNFTENFLQPFNEKDNTILKNVYSTTNGGKLIEGLATGMVTSFYDDNRILTVTTDHSVLQMDPFDYVQGMVDNEIFFIPVPEEQFKPMCLMYDNSAYYELLIMDHVVYARRTRWGNKNYSASLETSDLSPYRATLGCSFIEGSNTRSLYVYDELNGRFLKCPYEYNELQVVRQTGSGPFDINNVGKMNALFMAPGKDDAIYTVFETKDGGKRYLYTFDGGTLYVPTCTALKLYDLTSYPGIMNTVGFDSSPLEDVLYYATDKKVYSLLLEGTNPQAFERYEVEDPNEKITSIMVWRKGWQGKMKFKDSSSGEGYTTDWAMNRMMVITIYNESTKEGKIVAIPIMNIGSGILDKDKDFHQVYEGFGRILCITPQTV